MSPALVELLARLDRELAQVETILANTTLGQPVLVPLTGVAVWGGTSAEQREAAEAWAKQRLVEIARTTEGALLAETIGFKTFVESVEVG